MALAKYAEDNLEMYYERMAMREYIIKQDHQPQQNRAETATTQNKQKERDDEFRATLAGESCHF